MKDFLQHSADFRNGSIPQYIIEEEIFKKCVVDKKIANDLTLPAGVVPVTVANIVASSGPASMAQFNEEIALAREAIAKPLYEFTTLICQAFPGYTPQEVLALDYPEFMKTLAQAEAVLMSAGVLAQPLFLLPAEEPKKRKIGPPRDLKKEFNATKKSAVVEAFEKGEHAVTSEQIVADNTAYGIDSRTRKALQEEAMNIFPDLFKDMPAASSPLPEPEIVDEEPQRGGKKASGKMRKKRRRR